MDYHKFVTNMLWFSDHEWDEIRGKAILLLLEQNLQREIYKTASKPLTHIALSLGALTDSLDFNILQQEKLNLIYKLT